MAADGMKVRGDDNKFQIDNISGTVSLPTGAATAAKQLADGHAVSVSNAVAVTTVKPDGTNTMPSLDTSARRGYIQQADQFGWSADCTPNAELITTEKIRLVGSIFNGAVVDSNFWSTRVSTGTVTQASSELVITSGANNTNYAEVWTVRRANWVTGTSNKFRCQMRLQEAADADLIRRWGVGWVSGSASTLITDGACFKLTGTALSIVTHANSTAGTEVASAAFNGTYVAPTWTNNNTFEILCTLGKVYFLINSVIIHTVSASTTHWTSGTTNFHAFADANTVGDGSTAKTMTFRMMNISRLGSATTMPQYYHISGVAATYVLKLGGGMLHKIIFNNTTGTSVTVYDQTSAAVPIVALITTTTACIGAWAFECPFFNGLTVKTIGDNLDATVVYE